MSVAAQDKTRPEARDWSRSDLVARAEDIAALLRKNASKTDVDGRIPDENLAAIREAGLARLLQPEMFGGVEVDLRTSLEVQQTLAQGCGSTSWVAGLGNVSAFAAAHFPLEAQEDIWGNNPDARIVCVTSPAGGRMREVEGGWRISGKWRYASGSAYAGWAILGVPMGDPKASTSSHPGFDKESNNPDVGLALVPLSEGSIELSWDVTGMRGTRSDTVVMEDVFVPKHRQLTYGTLMSGRQVTPHDTAAHPLYRTPFMTIFALCLSASQVGLAKAAMRYSLEFAPTRVHPYSLRPLSQESTVQTLLAEAAYKADSAELHMQRAADHADQAAAQGRWLEGAEGFRGLVDGLAAARYSTESVRLMIRALMSSSFNNSNPLQRFWRDIEIGGSHLGWSNFQLENYGKGLLGLSTE